MGAGDVYRVAQRIYMEGIKTPSEELVC